MRQPTELVLALLFQPFDFSALAFKLGLILLDLLLLPVLLHLLALELIANECSRA